MEEVEAPFLNLRKEAELGVQARRLLDDEILQMAFANVEKNYIAEWRRSRDGDTVAREAIWRGLRALEALKNEIVQTINSGTAAEEELKAEAEAATQ